MEVIIEQNKYLQKFFKNNDKYSEKLKQQIYDNILTVINEKAYKIKTVNKLKYNKKTIFEYKISLEKDFVCRVAYTKDENEVLVFYISTNIIKANFTKEVYNLKGVTK